MNGARVAVVTGGTGALGRAVVRSLSADGWTVHVPSRAPEAARSIVETAGEAATRVHLHRADVGDPADVAALFAEVESRSGRLDALCNLAGGWAGGTVEHTSTADWDHLFRLNATATFLCCREAVPRLERSGGGAIVNVASAAALEPRPGASAYSAAKAAVVALTRALALELDPRGIRVNAIAPGTIDTEANRRAMPDADRSDWVRPDALAATVRWLLGPDGRALAGSVLEFGR